MNPMLLSSEKIGSALEIHGLFSFFFHVVSLSTLEFSVFRSEHRPQELLWSCAMDGATKAAALQPAKKIFGWG